jgi:hypothetical protein
VVALALIGALFAAAAIVAALILTSTVSIGSSASSNSGAAGLRAGRHHARAVLKPSQVNVTVLNGTTTTNLAHDITHYLDAKGYKTGTPATATDQNQTATVVGYLPGHRAGALLIARSLKLGRSSVQPASATNEHVACPQSSTCTAEVIVTVGTDLASAASASAAATSTSNGST